MTVSTEENSVVYRGNGATTQFAVPFKVLDEDHLRVRRRVFETGVIEYTYVGSDYSYSGIGADSGTLTLAGDALDDDYELVIERIVSYTQNLDIVNAGGFYPETVEEQLDLMTMGIQQIADLAGRGMIVPIGEDGIELTNVSERAGAYFAFDAEGNFVPSSGTGNDSALRTDLAASPGTSLISFVRSDVGAVSAGLQTVLRDLLPFRPEDFEAVGDGVTDDYAAFVTLAAAVSANGGGSVQFGKGKTYYIGQWETPANGVLPINFLGCNGLVIEGNGATISFEGDFDRVVAGTSGIGIQITDCTGVDIRNLELYGNVEETTNTANLSEDNNAVGLNIRSCLDVDISNVYVHHFATDGIAFRSGGAEASPGVWKACQRCSVRNSRFEYNSRCAMAVIGVRSLIVENCSLSYTARHTGTYGTGGAIGHSPKCGFDVEPTANLTRDGDQDVDTGDIIFRNCRIIDNLAGGALSNPSQISDSITVEYCYIVASIGTSGNSVVNLNRPGCIVRGNYIDALDSLVNLGNVTGGGIHDGFVTHVFEYNTVRGYNKLLNLASTTAKMDVLHNTFICTAAVPLDILAEVININNPAAKFENNSLFMPKEAFTLGGANDRHEAVVIGSSRRFRNNRWTTDLPANQSGATTAHYYITYGAGADATEVIDERFLGTAVGVADTFRPNPNGTFDTTYLYNRRRQGFRGVPGKQSLTDAAFTYRHGRDPMHLELNVPITANRTITLDTTDATEGAEVLVTRTAAATGAFNLTVASKALTAGQWAIARYSAAAWTEVAFGSL